MLYLKRLKTLLLVLPLAALFTACKKEEREPPFGAASLNPGRAP